MKQIAIFCGSSKGSLPIYMEAAFSIGQKLAKRKIGIVYGGAAVGLMGAVADGALSEGGNVIGVLPKFLKEKEIEHTNLSELILTSSMHERKAKMLELCDGVIALPGGFGTLEELFEVLTWAQLGLHHKPIGILNLNGFYDHLLQLLEHMVAEGFLKGVNKNMLLVSTQIDSLLGQMDQYQAPKISKWINEKTV